MNSRQKALSGLETLIARSVVNAIRPHRIIFK